MRSLKLNAFYGAFLVYYKNGIMIYNIYHDIIWHVCVCVCVYICFGGAWINIALSCTTPRSSGGKSHIEIFLFYIFF